VTDPPRQRLVTVAHRAGNTEAGLRSALGAGVDLVELDVHRYRGTLEVRHHKAAGPAHLYDAGTLVRRSGFPLVTLEEILAAAGTDPRLMLDLKGIPPRLAPEVAALLRERMPDLPVTVCSRHWWMLEAFAPPVRCVLSARSRSDLVRLRRRLARRRADGLSLHLDLLTPDLVRGLRERAGLVLTWPVDTGPALDRAREVGVDGVISKNLDLLAGIVGADGR
jgi:glycerophosphoryl diester phosphodiesterase